MAPTPQPAKLLLLHGRAPGKDSAGPVPIPPNFERAAPDPPDADWFDAEARAEWCRVVPTLDQLGLLKPEDYAALVLRCCNWSTYISAIRLLREQGLTTVNPASGAVHAHPAVAISTTAGAMLLRTCAEFGLTPSAERKLGTVTPPESDEDSPFITGS